VRRWALGFAMTLMLTAPALAQADPDTLDAKVTERLDQAKSAYGVPDPRLRCRPTPGSDEIVVCVDRGEDQRVPSTARSDPDSREGRRALDGNIPSAPDVASIKCRKGADGVCRGNFGGAPTPVYYADVTKLPEAPPGSDADKIAKGEVPEP
jgi:hypothetical protein